MLRRSPRGPRPHVHTERPPGTAGSVDIHGHKGQARSGEEAMLVFVNPRRWLFPMDLLERVGRGDLDWLPPTSASLGGALESRRDALTTEHPLLTALALHPISWRPAAPALPPHRGSRSTAPPLLFLGAVICNDSPRTPWRHLPFTRRLGFSPSDCGDVSRGGHSPLGARLLPRPGREGTLRPGSCFGSSVQLRGCETLPSSCPGGSLPSALDQGSVPTGWAALEPAEPASASGGRWAIGRARPTEDSLG